MGKRMSNIGSMRFNFTTVYMAYNNTFKIIFLALDINFTTNFTKRHFKNILLKIFYSANSTIQ